MTQEQTQTPSLEQTLERTDIGHYINHHRKSILIGAVVVVLGIAAYSVVNYSSSKSNEQKMAQLFEAEAAVDKIIEPSAPAPGADGKVPEAKKLTAADATEMLKIIDGLPVEIAKQPGAVPLVLKVVTEVEKIDPAINVTETLERFVKYFSTKEPLYFFLASKLAVLHEDAGNLPRAIELLEGVVAGNHKYLEGKTYLDLGRLYIAKGDKDKARKNFEHISKTFPNSDYAKLSELYLMEL